MPAYKRGPTPLKEAAADNEAAQKRATVNRLTLRATFEEVFSTPQGMEVYDWLMTQCGLYSSNQHQNSNVYRQEAQRDIANQIRKVSSNLHIQWLNLKAKKEAR